MHSDGTRQWTFRRFALVSLAIVAGFAGAVSYMAYDNRAEVVNAENARLRGGR